MKPILEPGNYFGHKQQSIEIAGGRFTEMSYAPDFAIPRHAHECAFFGFVLEGAYTETYECRNRECGPGSLLFHPEGEVHSESHEDVVVRIFSIEPAAHWLAQVRERASLLHQPFACQSGPMVQLAARLYGEFRDQDDVSAIALEGLLLELLAASCRQPTDTKSPRWLRQVRDLLHDRFTGPTSLMAIAQTVGVHPAHLARSFRQHYHSTVGDYIRDLRIERARHYLTTSDTPLSVIALELGYSDQSHFATAFKRHTGLTPTQFRKTFQKR